MVAFWRRSGSHPLHTAHRSGSDRPCACSDADEHRLTLAVVLFGSLWLWLIPPSIAVDLLAMMFAAMLLRGYHHLAPRVCVGRERMEGEALATVAGRLVFTLGAGGGVWLVDEPAAMLRVTFMGFLAGEMITLIMVARSMRALGLVWDPLYPRLINAQRSGGASCCPSPPPGCSV